MDESQLIKQWNQLRLHIIISQVAPALVLIGIFVLAVFDKFSTAPDAAKYLTIGVAAVTGILATISQYAAVREGEALVYDIRKVEKPSAVALKIGASRELLSLSAIALVLFDIAVIALVVWAVLGG
jgi:hypothetical protein